jgi:hypothetical protein
MKKIYLFFLLLPFAGLIGQTCSFDYAWLAQGKYGVWPDSATNFVGGTVGVPYQQNITVRVPYDTTYQGQTLHFSHIDLQTNISSPVNYGLPPGLSLTGTPSTFKFPGNDTSCMLIYGTPTTAGTYSCSFTLKTYVNEFGTIPVNTQTLNYYFIVIAPATGIATNAGYSFQVMQNMPNPVHDNASIKFIAPSETKVKFSLYNIAGQKMQERELAAQRGENSIDFDASQLENGIYLYTVELNHQKQCRRMVIAR